MSCAGSAGVGVSPGLGGVGNQSAVFGDLRADGVVDVNRGQHEIRAVDVGGEHDAIIADAHFHDVGDAIGVAQVDVGLADARGRVRDVDGGFAHAFAQLLTASARTATFNDRGFEIAVFAESFGHDGGVRQHGRRTRDLQLVTRRGDDGRSGKDRHGRRDQFDQRHVALQLIPEGCPDGLPFAAPSRRVVLCFATVL